MTNPYHMPSFSNPGQTPVAGGSFLNVVYTATGAEGTDFMVPILGSMNDDLYSVYWSPMGVASVPVPDLPNALLTDRTQTAFRVLVSAPLTAGDKLTFLLVEAS